MAAPLKRESESNLSLQRNTSYNIAGAVVPALIALATIPLYLSKIGAERFGVLSLIWLFAGAFSFFDLGLTRSTSYRLASCALSNEPRSAKARVLGSAATVGAVASVFGAAVGFAVLYIYFDHFFETDLISRTELLSALPLIMPLIALTILTSIGMGALQGGQRFLHFNVVSIVGSAGVQAAPLIAAYLFSGSYAMLLASMTFARMVALTLVIWSVHRQIIPINAWRTDTEEARHLRQFGKWTMKAAILGPIILYLDRLLLGGFYGGQAIATYNTPFQLAQRLSLVPTSIGSAIFPRMVAAKRGEMSRQCAVAISTSIALITLPVLAALYGMDYFIKYWLGDQLGASAADIARIIIVAFWFNCFGVIWTFALEAQGKPDKLPKLMTLELPLYLLFLYGAAKYGSPMWIAAVFAARCAIDSLILARLANLKLERQGILLGQGMLVVASLFLTLYDNAARPSFYSITLFLLLTISTVLTWKSLKEHFKFSRSQH